MARDDWFRNTAWNAEIEGAFFQKLGRARSSKQQYLRIQASMLASRQPTVSLRLLDEYFALGDYFDHAQAHVDRASAYLALGDAESAAASYQAALAREREHPRLRTQAWIKLPFLVATRHLRSHYPLALELLRQHGAQRLFALDHFRWHAAHALIFSAQEQRTLARQHARDALTAAAREHSGFGRHPDVGLVDDQQGDVRQQMSALAAA